MRLILSTLAVALTAGLSFAQCPGGNCNVQGRPVAGFAPLGPIPVGSCPSGDHEWGIIPGYGYGWKLRDSVIQRTATGPCGACPVNGCPTCVNCPTGGCGMPAQFGPRFGAVQQFQFAPAGGCPTCPNGNCPVPATTRRR